MDSKYFSEFPQLETKRLYLRQLAMSDVDLVYQMRTDPAVGRFIDRNSLKNREEAEALIEKTLNGYKNKQMLAFVAVHKQSGNLVGTCGFFNLEPVANRAEIGGEMSRSFWGKKLAVEAVKTLVNFALHNFKLHRIEAQVSPQNSPAIHLLDQLGFIKEAHFKDYVLQNGLYTDLAVYALINSEI